MAPYGSSGQDGGEGGPEVGAGHLKAHHRLRDALAEPLRGLMQQRGEDGGAAQPDQDEGDAVPSQKGRASTPGRARLMNAM